MKRRTSGDGWRITWVPRWDEMYDFHACIYYLWCKPAGKGYIGSTSMLHDRIKAHFGDMAIGKHGNKEMQAAWNEHGPDSFDWGVIESCATFVLEVREQHWINQYKPAQLFNVKRNVTKVHRRSSKRTDEKG